MPPPGEHADEAQPWSHLPDAAAALAEILVGQPRELVAPGLAEHALEQVAVARLLLPALVDDLARAAELVGEVVPQGLELGDPQEPRTAAGRRHAHVDRRARERGDQRVGEVALEALDLGPERPAGGMVVATPEPGERGRARVDRRLAGFGTPDLPDVIDDDHAQAPPRPA